MHKDRRRASFHKTKQQKRQRKLSRALFLYLSDLNFFIVFKVFYARYEKDHAPKSNRREKAAKWTNMAAKQVT